MTENLKTVASIYEAFASGDVATILDHLAPDVEWEKGLRDTGIPFLTERHGRDEVAGFFADLAENLQLTEFTVEALCDGGDLVAVPVKHAGRMIDGGEVPRTQEVHLWRFGPDGKVASFQHVYDYAVHENAMAGRAERLQGATLHVLADTIEVKRAGGRFEIFELTGPAESGPPPHAHPWDEAYIGLEGEVMMTIDGTETVLRASDVITVPAGTLHSYRILTDGAQALLVTSGHRASMFFADLDANTDPGPPTPESLPAIAEVAARNGLTSPIFA